MKNSDKLISDLTILGGAVEYICGLTKEHPKAFTQKEIADLMLTIESVHVYNPWFTKKNVFKAFEGISLMLNEHNLKEWSASYQLAENPKPKTVAIIMASNVPLVGFHDFLAVLVSGNRVLVKLSKDDDKLFPSLIQLLYCLDETYADLIKITDQKLKGFDAVIATGSDNTSRYFDYYFKKYPNIIRKNRTSIAVISETTTDEDLQLLADDIFDFYGLGCRNVSKILIPENFEMDRLFNALFSKNDIIHHHKYANNYDYNRAVHLMNGDNLLDNGFILLKESEELFSPLGMLFYQKYSDKIEVEAFIEKYTDKIQAVVGENHIPFGNSQKPSLTDYADGIDVMAFLVKL